MRSWISTFENWLPAIKNKLQMNGKRRFMLLLLFFNAMLLAIILLSVRNQEFRLLIRTVQIEITRQVEYLATVEAQVQEIVYITATPTTQAIARITQTPTPLIPTSTPTQPPTPTVTFTPTARPPTSTPQTTRVPTRTRLPPSPTPSPTPTVPTVTPTSTPTGTPTPTPTPTWTPTWTPTPIPVPVTIQLTVSPGTLEADGSSTSVITAHVFDQNGNPVPDGTMVTFSTNLGTFWGSSSVFVTTMGGTAQVVLTASTSAGTANIQATSGSAANSTTVRFVPRVQITKSVNRNTAPAGSPLAYTILIRNVSTGGDAALVRSLSDTLPPGFQYVPGSTTSIPAGVFGADPAISGQTLTWTPTPLPYALAAGNTVQVTFQVIASAGAGTYANTATVYGDHFTAASTGPTAQVTLQAPTIGSISLDQECNNIPVNITITGSNFAPGCTALLGNWPLSVTWLDENTLQATIPQGIAIGTYDLTVTNPGGASATLSNAYTALDCSPQDTTLESSYLATYGAEPGFSAKQGDDDQVQVIFFAVPEGTSGDLYIRIFDPDCGGTLDTLNGVVWDTPFTYTVYGGDQTYTHPDAKSAHPVAGRDSGIILARDTFTQNAATDGTWYTFGPFSVSSGEYVNGSYILKLTVIGGPEPPFAPGISFADLNLYNVALSTSPTANTAPDRARIFAFSWTFAIPATAYDVPPHMFPYVGTGTSMLVQHNWDYDNLLGNAGITITTPARVLTLSADYVSADEEERSSSHPTLENERGVTWAISCWAQPVAGTQNVVTFWATDQNNVPLALFGRSTNLPPP